MTDYISVSRRFVLAEKAELRVPDYLSFFGSVPDGVYSWPKLLEMTHFAPIDIKKDAVVAELNRLAYTFADKVGLNFDPLSNRDFFERLAFACDNRWGLVIELITAAFIKCKMSGSSTLDVRHFVEVFAKKLGMHVDFSPFTAPDYQSLFDPATLNRILNQAD